MTVLIQLVAERLDVCGDLRVQRRGQHLPSTVADDLVEQRPTGQLVGLALSWTTLSMGVPSRAGAPTPTLIETAMGFDLAREVRPLHVT